MIQAARAQVVCLRDVYLYIQNSTNKINTIK